MYGRTDLVGIHGDCNLHWATLAIMVHCWIGWNASFSTSTLGPECPGAADPNMIYSLLTAWHIVIYGIPSLLSYFVSVPEADSGEFPRMPSIGAVLSYKGRGKATPKFRSAVRSGPRGMPPPFYDLFPQPSLLLSSPTDY